MLIILTFYGAVSAEPLSGNPVAASILNTESGILEALRNAEMKPSVSGTLRCGVFIAPNGTLTSTHCYFKNSSNKELYDILLDAVSRVVARPAMVKETPKWVWLQFQVRYDINSQEYAVYQNLTGSNSLPAANHQGPQRYFRPRKCRALRGRGLVVTQYINKLGKIDRVELRPEIQKERLRKAISNCHLGMHFIPATRNGIPVDSILVEPFLQLRYNRMLEVKDRSLFGFGRRKL